MRKSAPYTELLNIMEQMSRRINTTCVMLGTVLPKKRISVGALTLDDGDYYVVDSIDSLEDGDTVVLFQLSEDGRRTGAYIVLGKLQEGGD